MLPVVWDQFPAVQAVVIVPVRAGDDKVFEGSVINVVFNIARIRISGTYSFAPSLTLLAFCRFFLKALILDIVLLHISKLPPVGL